MPSDLLGSPAQIPEAQARLDLLYRVSETRENSHHRLPEKLQNFDQSFEKWSLIKAHRPF